MKIHILSDLHNEFNLFVPHADAQSADLVILAGDIDIKARGVEWARQAFSCPVIYVAGNHEFYNGHLVNTLAKMRNKSCDRVRVLDNEEWVVNGVRFLCATAWTDYSLGSNRPLAEWSAHQSMNDFKKIRTGGYRKITPSDLVELNRCTKRWLRERLNESFSGPTIVVTHHAPSGMSLAPRGRMSLTDAAYANNWDDLMLDNVNYWIHGHSHYAVDYDFNGVRVIGNPRGYPGEGTGFKPGLMLNIENKGG